MGRNKIQKTWWAPHLPQEILGLILGKMQDPSLVDIIRFRAVCKNWRHVDDWMIKHQKLPWLCHLSWSDENPHDRLECVLYDPFSRQIFKTSKLVENRRYTRSYSKQIQCLGSKQGWLVAAYHNHFIKWEIFMYNPYTTEYIPLPFIWKDGPCFATFSGDPVSRDCRVFVFLVDEGRPCQNYIAIYGLNGEKEWVVQSLGARQRRCCGIQYMKEQVFCLFRDGNMIRYSLADGSCTQLVVEEGIPTFEGYGLQLLSAKGNRLRACKLGYRQCSIFHFDWSNMSWVESDTQQTSAVFVSDKITIFVSPFPDQDYDANNKYCKLYSFNDKHWHPSYYAFTEMRKDMQLVYYFTTVFIDPPIIN